MKASIKKDSPENLYDFEEDTSYEDFAAEEEKKQEESVINGGSSRAKVDGQTDGNVDTNLFQQEA